MTRDRAFGIAKDQVQAAKMAKAAIGREAFCLSKESGAKGAADKMLP